MQSPELFFPHLHSTFAPLSRFLEHTLQPRCGGISASLRQVADAPEPLWRRSAAGDAPAGAVQTCAEVVSKSPIGRKFKARTDPPLPGDAGLWRDKSKKRSIHRYVSIFRRDATHRSFRNQMGSPARGATLKFGSRGGFETASIAWPPVLRSARSAGCGFLPGVEAGKIGLRSPNRCVICSHDREAGNC